MKDKLRSYGVAHRELIPDTIHNTKQYENNRTELSHKATRVREDREELMAFFSFPTKQRQSINTSNLIESTLDTIRHRTERSKGCLSGDGMLHMMFKLATFAEGNWRRLRGFSDLAQVITGVKFKDGIEVKAVD